MRNAKIDYVAVGAFVLAMVVGLVVVVAMLTGRTGAVDNYHTVYDNVTGIKFGTQVLYEGFQVGQVEQVEPIQEGNRVRFRVDMSIKSGWKIPDDSIARVTASGLLAAITINISAGQSQTALKPGSQITGEPAANIFAAISSVAGNINDLTESTIKPLLVNLNRAVVQFGDIMEKDGAETARELHSAADALAKRLPSLMASAEASAKQVEGLLGPRNAGKIDNIIGNLDVASANIAKVSAEFEQTRVKIGQLVDAASKMVVDNKPSVDKSVGDLRHVMESLARHIDGINQNLDLTSRNMAEFSRHIRQNPGLLLGGKPPRDEAGDRTARDPAKEPTR